MFNHEPCERKLRHVPRLIVGDFLNIKSVSSFESHERSPKTNISSFNDTNGWKVSS